MTDITCKFKVDTITRMLGSVTKRNEDGSIALDDRGRQTYEVGEMRNVSLSPVYGNGDPNHENSKFWAATPIGKFELGTVNIGAAEGLELGAEYYIIIRKAE